MTEVEFDAVEPGLGGKHSGLAELVDDLLQIGPLGGLGELHALRRKYPRCGERWAPDTSTDRAGMTQLDVRARAEFVHGLGEAAETGHGLFPNHDLVRGPLAVAGHGAVGEGRQAHPTRGMGRVEVDDRIRHLALDRHAFECGCLHEAVPDSDRPQLGRGEWVDRRLRHWALRSVRIVR